jgi:general secretion pathway protein L
MIDLSKSILYLRIPSRADTQATEYRTLSFPFAVANHGRVQREGLARLDTLASFIMHVHRVVLLPAASDVTVLRLSTPPLSATRLKTALPSLVEESLLGDAADCQIVAGPDSQGVRTVAVIDRAWLRLWSDRMRSLGAHRLSVKPTQLCLPLIKGRVVAALLGFASGTAELRELVVRFSAGEGTGLPLGDNDDASAKQVVNTLLTLASSKPVELLLPREELERYQRCLSEGAVPADTTTVRVASWTEWIASINSCDIDLMIGAMRDDKSLFDTRRWRAAAIFSAAFIVINITALNWDWWRLYRESQRMQQEMQRVYSAAVRDAITTEKIDPENALAAMKKRRLALRRAAGESSADDFLVLSAALGDAWPALQKTASSDMRSIVSIEYKNAALELHLKPGLQLTVDTMRNVLSERGLEISAGSDTTLWKIRSSR